MVHYGIQCANICIFLKIPHHTTPKFENFLPLLIIRAVIRQDEDYFIYLYDYYLLQMIDKRIIWEEAGRKGLLLGCVSIIYMLLSNLTDLIGIDGGTSLLIFKIFSPILWLGKTFLCIWLLWRFMKGFAASNKDIDNSDSYRFGANTSFCSALVIAAFTLAYFLFIRPDAYKDAIQEVIGTNSLPEASISALESMVPSMPGISFVSTFLYCWLLGVVLSLIFSRNIPSRNPFSREQEEEW